MFALREANCRAVPWFAALFFGLLTFGGFAPTRTVQATDLDETVLALAPKDAAFVSSSIDLREALEDFINGRFVARLRAVPYIQSVESALLAQWQNENSEVAQAKTYLRNPNIRNALQLLQEMFSEEVFVYGENDWCTAIDSVMAFQNKIVQSASSGPDQLKAYLMSLTKEDVAGIHVPTTVIGFRVTDTENAQLQLDALESIIRLGGSQFEEAKQFLSKLKRKDFRGGQSLTFTLDTSMIDLEQIDAPEQEMLEHLMSLAEGKQFTFSLGLKDNTLLMTFSEKGSIIRNLKKQEVNLLDNELFSALKDASPERLRSVSYISKEFAQSQWDASFSRYFENLATQFSTVMASEAERIPDMEQWQQEIIKDARFMDSKLKDLSSAMDARLSWTNAIENGLEGYTYNFGKTSLVNGAPISLLKHAGEDPLVLFAAKQASSATAAELIEFMLKRYPDHLKRFITMMEDNEEDLDTALSVVDKSHPLVVEFYEVFRDQVCKAMGDEFVYSLSANWMADELPNLPPPSVTLPLPESAMALKIEDREAFIEGCDRLYKTLDKFVDLVREFEEDYAPGYSVPRPEEKDGDEVTRYTYSQLTDAVPLEGFSPQAAVSEDAIIFSYSEGQIGSMLEETKLTTRPGWMQEDTPVAAMTYVNWAGFVQMLEPWIQYGFDLNGIPMEEPLGPGPGPIPTGRDIMEIVDCFKSLGKVAGTTTVREDGSTVGRWVWVSQ